MNLIQRFLQYADAFEQTYEDDDWSRIEPFFADDASYTFGDQNATGRPAVLEMLRGSVNGLDRNMDSRTPEFEAPTVEGDTLHMNWKVSYTKSGLPDLIITGKEIVEFRGDRISSMRDEMTRDAQTALNAWLGAHGHELSG